MYYLSLESEKEFGWLVESEVAGLFRSRFSAIFSICGRLLPWRAHFLTLQSFKISIKGYCENTKKPATSRSTHDPLWFYFRRAYSHLKRRGTLFGHTQMKLFQDNQKQLSRKVFQVVLQPISPLQYQFMLVFVT